VATSNSGRRLLLSLATRLADLNLVQYSGPDAVYTENPDRPAVMFEKLAPNPDTAVSLAVYNELGDRDPWNRDYYVRMRFRAAGLDPLKVSDFADAVFDELETSEPTGPRQSWPGGVNVLTCFRVVRAQSAADANGRFMRADSYRITLNPGE
jgi:hypothetical protein